MVNAGSGSVPVSVDAVINSLTIQGIAFRGPFCTPGQRTVFVVESHILLESELAELLAQNKLDRDGIQEICQAYQAARKPPSGRLKEASLSRRLRKMTMRKDQRYRCQNPNCRDEIEMIKNSMEEDSNPLCRCGAKMKKVYSKPVFRELSAIVAIARFGEITQPEGALAPQNRE